MKKELLLSLLVLCGSCSKNTSLDKNLLLADTVQNSVLPSYLNVQTQAVGMNEAIVNFTQNPTIETLHQAQAAWREAHSALKRTEITSFGPYKDQHFDARMDSWPTRPSSIERVLADHESFDFETIHSLGSNVLGLPAMEYLLFDVSGNDQALIDQYTIDPQALRRSSFLKVLGEHFVENSRQLSLAWDGSANSFSVSLSEAGKGSERYPTHQSAITELVNEMVFLVELIKDDKLGKPLGKREGNPQPSSVESPYAHHSIAAMIANLEGLKDFYRGTGIGDEGLGLQDLVATQDAYISNLVILYINDAIEALKAIPEPLEDSIVSGSQLPEIAFEKLNLLKAILSTQVSSLLGVTPYFNDNDGD